MLSGPVVCILMFRVKGPYLSFGTLYEDKIYCAVEVTMYVDWTCMNVNRKDVHA